MVKISANWYTGIVGESCVAKHTLMCCKFSLKGVKGGVGIYCIGRTLGVLVAGL